MQLCRCKNNGITGGTIPIANAGALPPAGSQTPRAFSSRCPIRLYSHPFTHYAGIFVKNIVQYILRENQGIFKMFNLFTKDGNGAGGQVQLKLVRAFLSARQPALACGRSGGHLATDTFWDAPRARLNRLAARVYTLLRLERSCIRGMGCVSCVTTWKKVVCLF